MTRSGESLWRPVFRLVLAVGIAAFAMAALWRVVPDQLNVSSTFVGYPMYANFDVYRYTYSYYVIAFLFPACAVALYQLMAWKGPVRYRGRDRPRLFPLVTVLDLEGAQSKPDHIDRVTELHMNEVVLPLSADTSDKQDMAVPPASGVDLVDPEECTRPVDVVWVVARLLLAGSAVALELIVVQLPERPVPWSRNALVVGCYVLVVLVVSLLFRGRRARRLHSTRRRSTVRASLARSNSLLALVTIPLLYLVSQSTTMGLGSQSRLIHYHWLPGWIVGVVTVVGLVLWIRADRRTSSTSGHMSLEAKVLTWVCGPTVLFMLVALFPGALGGFAGFDDAQFLASPQLIFHHGLFPWRDIYVLHGLLSDVFDGKIGMIIFGNTRWGSYAGLRLLVYPVNVIAVYLFAAYFSSKNRLVIVGVAVALICGQFIGVEPRFLLLPFFLICFDGVLRRPTWLRCSLFMAVLVVGMIVTPEEILFIPCLLIPLVIFEGTGRRRHQSLVTSFTRTIRCGIAGAVLATAWILFLGGMGSLAAFIDYFRVFSAGHVLEGGIPANLNFGTQLMETFTWTIPPVLWLATIWRVFAKFRLRRVWSVADWVLMATAAISVIYYPKALDRADIGHMYEAFAATVPLLILWSIEVLSAGDRWVRSVLSKLPERFPGRRWQHVMTIAAILAIFVGANLRGPSIYAAINQVQSKFHPAAPIGSVSTLPRLGYTVPGSVDTAQIRTLGAMLERYAGSSAPVFDYSNQLGIAYYLLNRVPGTRYYYAAVVQSDLAQKQVISELQESKPPVVIFTDTSFGLSGYDSIPQELRSYLVSSYIYSSYQPLLSFQGQLLLIRKDLAATAPPVPSGFNTDGLYFAGPECSFGNIPNFFPSPTEVSPRAQMRVPVTQSVGFTTTTKGWVTPLHGAAPVTSVVAVDGRRVVGTSPPLDARPDVAANLHDPAALNSGFTITTTMPKVQTFTFYAMHPDGTGSPLALADSDPSHTSQASSTFFVSSDGVSHRVVGLDTSSHIDSTNQVRGNLITLHLPPGTSTQSYTWLRLNAGAPFGTASLSMTDLLGAPAGHVISFSTLPRVGTRVDVRVGSCLQWQGYGSTHELYLQRQGARLPAVTSATFIK